MLTLQKFRQYIQSKEEEALGIITPPTYYYLRIFEIFGQKKFFLSWNWAAFFVSLFCGHIWFAYRRMYILAILFWIVAISLIVGMVLFSTQVLPQFISLPNPLLYPKIGGGLAMLFLANFMGVFANTLYFTSTRYAISKGYQKRGTSFTSAILAWALGILILSFIRKFGILHL